MTKAELCPEPGEIKKYPAPARQTAQNKHIKRAEDKTGKLNQTIAGFFSSLLEAFM